MIPTLDPQPVTLVPAPATRRALTTVCCAAHKGGVGKTTTAMALSAALARAGDPVLLVDLDPQGHSTMGLGLDVDDEDVRDWTVRELLADDPVPLRSVVHQTGVPNLSIVPATLPLERFSHWLVSASRRSARLSWGLRDAVGRYAWVIVDCPPSLGALTENAITAADALVIPCRMEARATDGVKGLLEVLDDLYTHAPGDKPDWRILRNARDVRRRVSNEFAETMFTKYAGHVLETVIPQCDELNKAQFAGEDIFRYDAGCSGAKAYQQLAEDVKTLWAPQQVTT